MTIATFITITTTSAIVGGIIASIEYGISKLLTEIKIDLRK